MKKLLSIIIMLLASTGAQAYTFTYRNATGNTIYFEPFAYDPFSPGTAKKFFAGDKKAQDGWNKKGAQILKAKEQKSYDFKGVWCHGKLMVGKTKTQLKEVPIFKADLEQYRKIISHLTEASIASAAGPTALFAGPFIAGVQLARLFEKTLCRNYSFIIGKKKDGTYFATATPF